MRIEISSGGIGNGTSALDFQTDISSFIATSDAMISSFKAVKNDTYNLSGGVGNLQSALDDIGARIQTEESARTEALSIQAKTNDFLALANIVDRQVSSDVNNNREELYNVCPWLKPVTESAESKPWYEQAWDWMCGAGEAIADGVGQAWNWISDTASKAWAGLVEFYNEHKKIIDTILIVVGAVLSIAAVIATGGVALVPLLSALGVSTATAIAISTTVAVVAVVSTVAASTLNIIDTWCEIDNPLFNGFQKALNITSAVTNLAYSIGNIYNSFKGVSGKEFIARQNAIENGKLGYSGLETEHPNMNHQSGADFDQARKQAIYKENMSRNNGQLRSDQTGKLLDPPTKSMKGVSPSPYEAQIDHIYPRDLGGANSFGNAQVIERSANIAKGANPYFTDYMRYSRPDVISIPKMVMWGTQGVVSSGTPYLNN